MSCSSYGTRTLTLKEVTNLAGNLHKAVNELRSLRRRSFNVPTAGYQSKLAREQGGKA